jgi:purine-binding chemotaxis protein CheW
MTNEKKYLTFALGHEEYGLEILQVREIIGLMEVTALPEVPPYVKGVINLRGKIIPVVDLRLKFGMSSMDYTSETCIIVLHLHDAPIGILVDKVREVLDIGEDSIEPVPSFGTSVHADYIKGIGKVGDKVKILLDIERVLTQDVPIAKKAASHKVPVAAGHVETGPGARKAEE